MFLGGGKGGAGVGEWIGERVLEGLISGILNPKPIPSSPFVVTISCSPGVWPSFT